VRHFVVELRKPNPAGRRTLTFEFRVRPAWSAQVIGQVCELLEFYFRTLVRAWYRALASALYTAAEVGGAIEAKVAGLAGHLGERAARSLCRPSRPFPEACRLLVIVDPRLSGSTSGRTSTERGGAA
jgi:hypothetical protein